MTNSEPKRQARSAPRAVGASRDKAAGASNAAEYSVSDLAGSIKRALEDGFGHVRLRGEISGFRGPHSSGHCYFSLKDERAKIDAVVWRGVYSKLKVKPEEGMEVIAQGRVTTYPNSSKYQIVIEAMEPAGVGALMALLEERKKKFAAEGLFDEARKRPIPFLPRTIGVITSPTGAVIRDMLHGFNERFPAHVIVWPVRVQGEASAGEVAAAIRGFNAIASDGPTDSSFGGGQGAPVRRPDLLIVARGGGSLEDLWSFNEEIVVRAASESTIPLIAAVGHETDWTLVDLVADARAPTPTKAAEWAVPKFSDLLTQNDDLGQRIKHAARRRVEAARSHLLAASRGLPRLEDIIALPRQRFDAMERRLGPALLANARAHAMRLTRADAGLRPELMKLRITRARERLDGASARLTRSFAERVNRRRAAFDTQSKLLATLGYEGVLKRGYALVRTDGERMVRSAAALNAGARVTVQFHDGVQAAQIEAPGAADPAPSPRNHLEPDKTRIKPRTKPSANDKQGSLF